MTTQKVVISWWYELGTQQSLLKLPFHGPIIADVAGTLECSAIEPTYKETIPPVFLLLLRLWLTRLSLLLFIVRNRALRVFLIHLA